MSGIYIPMEMPKRCGECPLSLFPHSPCWENGGALDWENRPNWCPLIPVPDHGDLVDLNEAADAVCCCDGDVWLDTKQIHIVLPAEEGEG